MKKVAKTVDRHPQGLGLKTLLESTKRYRSKSIGSTVISFEGLILVMLPYMISTQIIMALLNEALGKYLYPKIFNTDQGRQYASEINTQRLKNTGITISMDGKGRTADNICIECIWRRVKCERAYLNAYQSIGKLNTDASDLIEFYSHRRFHQTLNYKKSNERPPRKYKIKPEKEGGFLGFSI